jgi:lipopolysaccharide biosynthesis protein
MLIEDYFPLVKRRIFYPSATGYSLYSPIALSVLKHIEACCADYDLSLIVKDLQRTRMVEPYNISPWRLLGLKLHMRLAFTRAKRMKRAQKYEWARQSCELYQFLTQYSN